MKKQDKESHFAAAVNQHKDALFRVCCAYVRDRADRQDIYQEVLIHIWKSLDTFRGQSKLATWIYRIAVNTCLGWLRHEKRRHKMLERVREEERLVAAGSKQEITKPTEGDIQRLYVHIARLAPVDRLLVSLYLEEMDSTEMAEVLGISEGNVRVKLHRIKKQLRNLWEKKIHEPR